MATKITISKRLEAEIREALFVDNLNGFRDSLCTICDLLNAAREAKVSPGGLVTGLSPAVFLGAIETHRPVVKPPSGPIGNGAYARLSKCLRVNGVTEDQATSLGVWLAGEGLKAAPGDITIDRIIKNLGDWITRALANKPDWSAPEW